MSSSPNNFPELINIDDTIIEREIFQEHFVCDLNACKGACCVEGEAGAPLLNSETETLEMIYDQVKPFMREEGKKAVRMNGKYLRRHGFYETPLVNNKECAYVHFDEDGTAKCAIETAYRAGKTSFKKPISCHLYPIRITKDRAFLRLRYDKWAICKAACHFGKKVKVRIFEFLKEPLIRRFGQDWYNTMEAVNKHYSEPTESK